MNAFRGLKGKLVGAHERIGKGVELVREVVGVFISETDGTTSGHGRDNEARRLAVVPADSCSEDSGHAAAKTQFRDEWQTYIKVATAETRQGEDARLKQLDVVLQAYDGLCEACSSGSGVQHSVGFRMDLSAILGQDNSFCAEFATIACAEMEKLEWQLKVNAADKFEDAVSIHSAQSGSRPPGMSESPGLPSLLKCVQVLLSVQWNSKDVAAFRDAGLLEVLISSLSDCLHADSGVSCRSAGSAGVGESGSTGDGEWEPSELDEAMWMLTGKLLLRSSLVRSLSDVACGKEALSLLFDMASLDARTDRQRWSRGQALSALRLVLDYCDSVLSMAAYLQAYGCIGKVLQRLTKSYTVSWQIAEVVRALGVVVDLVHALAPVTAKMVIDFELGDGCALFRRVIVWIQKEAAAGGRGGAQAHPGGSTARLAEAASTRCSDFRHHYIEHVRSAVSHLGKLVILNDEPVPKRPGAELVRSKHAPCGVKEDEVVGIGKDGVAPGGGGRRGAGGGIGTSHVMQRKLGSMAALDTLVLVFEEAVMSEARHAVLEVLGRIYAGHPANYHLLSAHHEHRTPSHTADDSSGLARLIRAADLHEASATEGLMQTLQRLSTLNGCRPLGEFRAVSQVLVKNTPFSVLLVICKTLNEVVSHDSSYRDVFWELGIVQALLHTVLERFARNSCDPVSSGLLRSDSNPDLRLDPLMIETLQVLSRGNRRTSQLVRLRGLPRFLQLVWHQSLSAAVLRLLCQITASGDHDDVEACVAGLCEVLHSEHGDVQDGDDESARMLHSQLTCEILLALSNMVESEAGLSAFRLYGGFEIVLGILQHRSQGGGELARVDADVEGLRSGELSAMIIARALSLLSVATHESPENHNHLWNKVGLDTLELLIEDTRILFSSHAPIVLQSLLGMSCGRAMCLLNIADDTQASSGKQQENDGIKAMAWKAEALVLLIGLCKAMSVENCAHMLFIVSCIAQARPDNAQELAANGAVRSLLQLLVHGPDDALVRKRIVGIISTIGSVHLDPTDARRLFKLCWETESPWRALLLPVLLDISQTSGRVSSSYIRFSMEVHGYASAEIPLDKEIAWPPSAGYTIAFWVFLENFGKGPMHLMHLFAQAKTNKDSHKTSVLLNKYVAGQLSMQIGDADELCFSSFSFHPGTWYHVVLVHVQNKLQKSEASLFVNGQLREVGKLRMGKITSVMDLIASPATTDLTIFLGLPHNAQPQGPSSMQWRMRGVMVVEEPLTAETILAMCRCGYSYNGCYQSESFEGEIGAAVVTAWQYAAVDSPDFDESPADVSRVVAKVSWDKLIFASRFLDRRECRKIVLGKVPDALKRTFERGGVHNLKQSTLSGKLGWMRGDATVVTGLSCGDSLQSIGGVAVVLATIETCTSGHELVMLLKILRGTLWRNALNLADMNHLKGYEVVAGFLQRRPEFMTQEVVDELMHIAGFGQSSSNELLANAKACEHLVLDIRMWRRIDPINATKVFKGLQSLLSDGRRRELNASVFETIGLVPFLCFYMYQPHLDENTCANVVCTLERFLDFTVRMQYLHMVAQLMLTGKCAQHGQALELSPDPRAPRNTRFCERPWLKVQLISMLLRLVRKADAPRLALFCASFEPMWFALMFQQCHGLESSLALIQILTVLLGENESYCKAFRRENPLLLIGSQLEGFHWSFEIYLALFRLMLAAHVKTKVTTPGVVYSADILCDNVSISEDSNVTMPEVLPLILRLLKFNINFEVASRTNMADAYLSDNMKVANDAWPLPSQQAAAGMQRPSAAELSEVNCVTVQILRRLCATMNRFNGLCMGSEVVEALVGLMFLVKDDAFTEGESGPTGVLSKMTGVVTKGLGSLLRIRGPDVAEDESSGRVSWMTAAKAAATSATSVAKAAAASAAAAQAVAMQGVTSLPHKHDAGNEAAEDDGWEDLGGESASDDGMLEKERRVSLGFTDVEHVATAPPVPSAAEDGNLDFHTSAGELIFHMLCRVVQGGIRTPSVGSGIVSRLLEAIPLAVPTDDERLFGGVILSQVCKLLHKNSQQADVMNGDLVKQLVAFAEMMTDFVCADCFAVNYRDLMEFTTLLIQQLQTAESTGYTQDATLVARHLGSLHKTTNRVVLHLLSRLQQSPDRLRTFVEALGDHVQVVFGPQNTDAPMIVLIANTIFDSFFNEKIAVRHGAMRVWGHLLEHRRSVMLPLLSYSDADGTANSLFADGFGRLVVNSAEAKGDLHDAAVAVAISDFEEWLSEGHPSAKRTQSGFNNVRCARVAAIVHDNAAKHRVKVVSLEQQYHAEVQKRHYKNRQHRLQRLGKRLTDEEAARSSMKRAAEEAESKAISQWRHLVRTHWQNLESHSVFTQQQWTRDKLPLLRERGVLGQRWSDLETCAWRADRFEHMDTLSSFCHVRCSHATAQTWVVGYARTARVSAHVFFSRPSVVTWTQTCYAGRRCLPHSSYREGSGLWCPRSPEREKTTLEFERKERSEVGGIGFKRLWWRLDATEGPQRMRRRLELDVLQSSNPSFEFVENVQRYRPIKNAHKRQSSRGAGGFWEAKEEKLEPDAMLAHLRYDGGGWGGSGRRQDKDKGGLMSSLVTSLLGPSDSAIVSETNVIDHDKFTWLLDSTDDILAIHNCMRLFSGTTVSGVLLVCTHHIYVFDYCQVHSTGEVSMFDGAAAQEPVRQTIENGGDSGHAEEAWAGAGWEASERAVVHRWSHTEIRDLQRRKYLLRPVGIEMFINDGLDCLLIFHKSERDSVYDTIMSVRQDALAKVEAEGPDEKMPAMATQATAGEAALDLTNASQTSELAQGRWTGRSSRKTLLHNLRRLWQEGDISNLQYLMHLNTLAGRSYNDLTQYPIFPWVLRDYSSQHLDLSNPAVFRDLSKPMGAQDDVRAREYKKRYDNWLQPDQSDSTPPFHYATHYSSAAAVTFYLIRLEPFTTAHVKLQGGKFDHADRMFSSVQECWESASQASLSDVKELIPEFYYMPDLFVNGNRLDLGTRQKTLRVVDDVDLPPWAHGSADEYVRKMRMALESDHVSARLHHWIDLVFGCRQRGPAAAEALNVFHHLTYEGNVDVDSITDPVERMSTIAQILNFGQTPTQLFDKPHPPREAGLAATSVPQLCTDPSSVETTTVRDAWRGGDGAVRDVRIGQDGKVMVVSGERILCLPALTECLTWGHQDGSLRFISIQRTSATASLSSLTGATASLSSLMKSEPEKLVACYESLHQGVVTVAASSEDGKILVTGSSLGDLSVWRQEVRAVAPSSSGSTMGTVTAGIQAVRGTEKTVRRLQLRQRLCAHTGQVTCLVVSNTHAVMLSGSTDGTVILWDTRRLRFMRQLIADLEAKPESIDLNQTGSTVVVAAGREVRVVSINGSPLGHVVCDEDLVQSARSIRAPEWAVENPVIVSGHASGAVRFWRLLPKKLSKLKSWGGQAAAAPATDAEGSSGSCRLREEKLSLDLIFACHRSHQHAVTSISFSGDGHQMWTGDAGGVVSMWGKDRKSGAAHGPKWLLAAARAEGQVVRVDERLLRGISVRLKHTERAESEGGPKLIANDFVSPEVYVLEMRLPRPETIEDVRLDSSPAPSDLTWEARRSFAQFAELQLLLQRHGGVASATLPPKKPSALMAGREALDHSAERDRQQGLALFLSACLQQCTARQTAILCAFVQAPDSLYQLSQTLLK